MKNKILLTLGALALTLVLGLGNVESQDTATSYDGKVTYMYDPDINGEIG